MLPFGEEQKFPSSCAKITKVGLQLHFGWATVHPGNRLSNINPGEVLIIPFFTGLFPLPETTF
jgi:hypothetical protein